MEKHTVGPWRLFSARRLAHLHGTAGYFGLSLPFVTEQDKANARLIAASPTMYEYIARRAATGDNEALALMEAIDAS